MYRYVILMVVLKLIVAEPISNSKLILESFLIQFSRLFLCDLLSLFYDCLILAIDRCLFVAFKYIQIGTQIISINRKRFTKNWDLPFKF